jgi:hypothetical protein
MIRENLLDRELAREMQFAAVSRCPQIPLELTTGIAPEQPRSEAWVTAEITNLLCGAE